MDLQWRFFGQSHDLSEGQEGKCPAVLVIGEVAFGICHGQVGPEDLWEGIKPSSLSRRASDWWRRMPGEYGLPRPDHVVEHDDGEIADSRLLCHFIPDPFLIEEGASLF